jgi:endoglucanase
MKQIKMLMVCILLILAAAVFGQTLGDANSDDSVDIVDALVTAQFYVGLTVTIDENAADVNCDDAVNIVDALLIAQFYVGLIPEFPCEGGTTVPTNVPTATPVSTPGPTGVGPGKYNYGETLQKAIFFYKAQRSGDLPDDYPLIWRSDSCLEDGADVGLDLTGGWYDAGDHVKFNLPMAFTAAQLGWAIYEYGDAIAQAGQLDILLDEIKWAADYFIKCHPSANTYYFQCGLGTSDHGFWGPPEVIHLTTDRSSSMIDSSNPGTDVAGQTAAALAIASIIFEDTDPSYASVCLSHARELFTFADNYRGFYPVEGFYVSSSYMDDLAWAAIWLHIKTGESEYLEKADEYTAPLTGGKHTHCWDDVSYGAVLKMAQLTQQAHYIDGIEISLDFFLPGGGVTYTPGGLAWLDQWGSLRYASGAAFLAFVWADSGLSTPSRTDAYLQFGVDQMHYILGDNPRGGSYVVGYGENPPVHPHHKAAHCSWVSQLDVPSFHRHTLYGALVGGPGSDDVHNDDVTDYTMNEVADDYNAAFTGCMAKMYSMYGGDPIPGFPGPEDFRPVEDRLTEFFARAWITGQYTGQVNIFLQINNRSAWPPRLTDSLSCRYFFDISELIDEGYSADDITPDLQESQGAAVSGPYHWSGNIYYILVDFTGTLMFPGGWDYCEKDAVLLIKFPTGAAWDSSNDYSAQGLGTTPDYDSKVFTGLTPYIPVYEDGELLWGQEP